MQASQLHSNQRLVAPNTCSCSVPHLAVGPTNLWLMNRCLLSHGARQLVDCCTGLNGFNSSSSCGPQRRDTRFLPLLIGRKQRDPE
jgi:hypothetical protein